jgi:2-dehydropantoate 2-reductase
MRSGNTAVVGVGPVGGILGAYLIRAGFDVALVDVNEAHVDRMRKDGLAIEGPAGFTVPAKRSYFSLHEAIDAGEQFDLVYVCVKTSVINQVAEVLPGALTKTGAVVGFHNGIDTEGSLVSAVGPERVIRGVTNYAGNRTAPGRIRMTFFNPPNYVGGVRSGDSGSDARAKEVALRLTEVGLVTEVSKEIRRYVWEKVIRNVVLAPVSALTRLDMAQVMGSAHGRHLVETLLQEAIAVAAKAGYSFGDDFYDVTLEYLEKAGHHKPSMLSDVLENRRTEIGFQNKKIVEYGEKLGVPTPCNRVITDLVQCIDDLLVE